VLEQQLQSNLRNARVFGSRHITKQSAAEVPHRSTKLGVVEDIETLKPELQDLRFRDVGLLQKGQIPIVQARPMEEAFSRGPQLSNAFRTE
jgi:hypothetical protein